MEKNELGKYRKDAIVALVDNVSRIEANIGGSGQIINSLLTMALFLNSRQKG